MKVLRVSQLFESNLNTQELSKRGTNGLRGDILVNKILNLDSVTINRNGIRRIISIVNKEEIIPEITNINGKYDPEMAENFFKVGNRYDDVIEGSDGVYYKLNDIEKTSDFGSSRGSSLGSSATREMESLQCLMLSYRQSKGEFLKKSDYDLILSMNKQEFNSYLEYIDTTIPINKELLRIYIQEWGYTFMKISNALYNRRAKVSEGEKSDFILSDNISYKFYHTSSINGVCKVIKEKYKEVSNSINIFKWSPSDIWAVSIKDERSIIRQILSCRTLGNLNRVIDENFDSRKLIGISLKKVNEPKNVKLVINKITKIPQYTFSNIKLAKDAASTTGLKIIADRYSYDFGNAEETMTIRSFSGQGIGNISGEVDGKSARGGKVSLSRINEILRKNKIEVVPTIDDLSEWSDNELLREIKAINKKIINIYDGDLSNQSYRTQMEINRARLISKYQSLYLAWILMENKEIPSSKEGKTVSDLIIQEMFLYALSIMFNSRRTPKYVRVID